VVEPWIEKLQAPGACQDLTFPHYRSFLTLAGGPNVCAHVLQTPDGPKGLCLGLRNTEGDGGQIASLYIAPELRNQGWGGRLIAPVEEDLKSRGAVELGLVYTNGPSAPALEALLRRAGWGEPQRRTRLGFFRSTVLLAADWVQRAKLADGFSLFTWQDLPKEERAWILDHVGQPGWHRAALSPFAEDDKCESQISVGLRYHGEIAGWLVLHRVIAGSIRCTTIFVREDLRRHAPHVAMTAESLRRHVASPIALSHPSVGFIQPLSDPAVSRFFERRLSPYVDSIKETRACWKKLS
jgi:GNAT superfamily N-acetyltransferase